MGKAAAVAVASRGGSVLIASRSQEKLDSAAEEIRLAVPNVQLTTRVLDASDEMAVQAFGAELDAQEHQWDALICTAAGKAPHGPIGEVPTSDTADLFASKFWTAHNSCKHIAPRLTDGGAVALTAGVLNRRPGLNCSPLAAVNGALELNLARTLTRTRTRTLFRTLTLTRTRRARGAHTRTRARIRTAAAGDSAVYLPLTYRPLPLASRFSPLSSRPSPNLNPTPHAARPTPHTPHPRRTPHAVPQVSCFSPLAGQLPITWLLRHRALRHHGTRAQGGAAVYNPSPSPSPTPSPGPNPSPSPSPNPNQAAMLANTAASLPLRRVGQPADMGEALYYLVSAPFVTGVVLDCDGGHHIRQYADKASDPMRAAD